MPADFMNIWLPLIVAALVQASFALGVSMLTLLSSHILASKKPERLGRLSFFYIEGIFMAVFIGLAALVFFLVQLPYSQGAHFWAIISGAATGIGLMVLLFYYSFGKKNGTRLWIPRASAEFLYKRTRAVSQPFEAFILGVASVIIELVFIIAPLVIAANLIVNLAGTMQILAIFIYVVIAILPTFLLYLSNLRRNKISNFQLWREKNKKFLQVTAGFLLMILGIYLFTYKAIGG
ncbi:MAG: hypothetical protein LBM09_01330 [Candidatus Nomurabacteria bacterium]|jgi:hypothetical protein|nr:hypothetical protein [Candidatus Nomurabacteria bacterium]